MLLMTCNALRLCCLMVMLFLPEISLCRQKQCLLPRSSVCCQYVLVCCQKVLVCSPRALFCNQKVLVYSFEVLFIARRFFVAIGFCLLP